MAQRLVKVVLDTSIYIPYINEGVSHPVFELEEYIPIIYMSAVVMEELYAGAHDRKTVRLLDKLYDTFQSLNRLITPDAQDWQQAGKVIARMGRKYGFEKRFLSRITNDVLIAITARKIGALVITKNKKDFSLIREFLNFKMLE